ncbi:MAG: PD-(D/E)XK nuclease family protein, partial [Actinomycetes bacterium]
MASSNAVGSAREFISPSDLTFSWGSCHKCLWLNYNHGLRTPGFMPLVGDLANMQENYFAAKTTADIAPVLPAGKVADLGGWVKSSFIDVNGSPTKYAIRGKYDLLIEFADSTFGIIDCKFQAKDSDKTDLYQPQLEAYAFALENPATGPAKKVSLMGLLVWSLIEP